MYNNFGSIVQNWGKFWDLPFECRFYVLFVGSASDKKPIVLDSSVYFYVVVTIKKGGDSLDSGLFRTQEFSQW